RGRFKVVPPIEQWNVRREFLRRLKKAYDARGIEIPFPHLTLYSGAAKDGGAPALQVRTLREPRDA
ncbi:MAG: mechanosensitive ion channel family protein, partial [Betaproteobacteria bacterium]|nr:mechanosensitive ion channel family protein [Betaproteobacteria bacterium]